MMNGRSPWAGIAAIIPPRSTTRHVMALTGLAIMSRHFFDALTPTRCHPESPRSRRRAGVRDLLRCPLAEARYCFLTQQATSEWVEQAFRPALGDDSVSASAAEVRAQRKKAQARV